MNKTYLFFFIIIALNSIIWISVSSKPESRNDPATSDAKNFPEIDPTLFATHDHKTPYSIQEIPPLCVALLSCRRLEYLRRTVKSIINYLAKVEPWVKYEIVLVDNGSDDQMVRSILEEFPIEKVALLRKNYGITVGINLAFQGLCQSPYILSIEDDWESRWQDWDVKVPALSMAMSILSNDPKVLEVWLRDVNHEHPVHQNRDLNWTFISASGNTPKVQYKRQYVGEGGEWGVYTNGASLKRKSSLEQIGKMVDIDGELEYAMRTGKLGWASGIMCFLSKGCSDQYARTNFDTGLFYHIGAERSPGRKDFKGTWNE